jgi:hypothetical protein
MDTLQLVLNVVEIFNVLYVKSLASFYELLDTLLIKLVDQTLNDFHVMLGICYVFNTTQVLLFMEALEYNH